MTPLPTATPGRAVEFLSDQLVPVEVPDELSTGLRSSWFSFLTISERADTTDLLTPVPGTGQETLYIVNPSNGQTISVVEFPTNTQGRIFWSPDGRKLVYFLEPALLSDGTRAGGLYLLNLELGLSLRLFDIPSLNPRGIPDHQPVWSPDSSQVAVVLPTAYDVDIFAVPANGSVPENLTEGDGSYNLWPAWSPDGRRLAFVSDQSVCPTWVPGEPGSCSAPDATPPNGGTLHVLDLVTGDVWQVSDLWVDGPPTWVSNLQISFTTGLSDPFAGETHVWLANIQSGTVHQVSDQDALSLGAAWAPGGARVLYHRASEPAAVVLKDGSGRLIAEMDEYTFPRFGFAASWSPDGEWVAFAGRNGQCPYGLIVTNSALELSFYPHDVPRVCDPVFSPDGNWLAYAGIVTQAGGDGRLDLYVAQPNGYGQTNLTQQLRGEIRLLGWVGPASQ